MHASTPLLALVLLITHTTACVYYTGASPADSGAFEADILEGNKDHAVRACYLKTGGQAKGNIPYSFSCQAGYAASANADRSEIHYETPGGKFSWLTKQSLDADGNAFSKQDLYC